MSDKVTVYPAISHELLSNPGIGFTIAPGLIGEQEKITDNRGVEHAKYKFSSDSITYNHPDSKVSFISVRWKDIEKEKGQYDWSLLDERLENAKQLGCTSVVRCSPYALHEDDDIPAWFRKEQPDTPEFPFWRVDPHHSPYVAYWADFIKSFAQQYDGHPLITSIDLTIVGAWGEGGGTEFLSPEAVETIVDAYIDHFKLTPLQCLLHDPVSNKIIADRRAKVGFRVDCLGDMGGFHGQKWTHMTDFYPQNIQNFGMADAWKQGPVLFEACWHMNDWYINGWDIDYIIDETLKWHITSFNNKSTVVPEPWKDKVEAWLKKMGYRFELRKLTYSAEVLQGEELHVTGLWANVGVAPIYNSYPLVIKLVNETDSYSFTSQADIRQWMPDEDILWHEAVVIPETVNKGTYTLQIGIETGIQEVGNIKLAIEGCNEGYYKMGLITIR